MKKISIIVVLMLAVIGIVGGFLFALSNGEYVIAAGEITAGIVAFPALKELFNTLVS